MLQKGTTSPKLNTIPPQEHGVCTWTGLDLDDLGPWEFGDSDYINPILSDPV